jgi:hypothetical protein
MGGLLLTDELERAYDIGLEKLRKNAVRVTGLRAE